MVTMLVYAALFLAGALALAGFACYICRGRPATHSLSRQNVRERRALQEIERHLLTGAEATGSDNSRQNGW